MASETTPIAVPVKLLCFFGAHVKDCLLLFHLTMFVRKSDVLVSAESSETNLVKACECEIAVNVHDWLNSYRGILNITIIRLQHRRAFYFPPPLIHLFHSYTSHCINQNFDHISH